MHFLPRKVNKTCEFKIRFYDFCAIWINWRKVDNSLLFQVTLLHRNKGVKLVSEYQVILQKLNQLKRRLNFNPLATNMSTKQLAGNGLHLQPCSLCPSTRIPTRTKQFIDPGECSHIFRPFAIVCWNTYNLLWEISWPQTEPRLGANLWTSWFKLFPKSLIGFKQKKQNSPRPQGSKIDKTTNSEKIWHLKMREVHASKTIENDC